MNTQSFLPTYKVNTIDLITSPPFSNSSISIKNLIFNDYKVLYSSKSANTNKLLLIEAPRIELNKPEINSGLKASKELELLN